MADPALYIIISLASYLVGSVPTGYLLGRLMNGLDIRSVGSGNVGALNAFRQLGPRSGLFVLLLDGAKGALVIGVANQAGPSVWLCVCAALGVVVGHNWPIYLGFRGGKGVAPALGVSLAMFLVATLGVFAFAAAIIAISRNVVLAAALGFLSLNIFIVATGQGWEQVFLCVSLTIIVTATYLGRSWKESLTALKRRRLQDLFVFE